MSLEPSSPPPGSPWSEQTRDRWFYGALATSVAALLWLLMPFMSVLLMAGTTVVVTWPLYQRILRWMGGRRLVASVCTTLLLAFVIFVPLSLLLYRFALEAAGFVDQARDLVVSGEAEATLSGWLWKLQVAEGEWGSALLALIPEDTEVIQLVLGPVQEALVAGGQAVAVWIPGLVGVIASGSIDAVIYVAAVGSLYMHGPTVLRGMMRLSPMDDVYERRLFDVFQEFSNNLVVGSLATAAVQGVVASIGYAIGGVERVIFVSLLTAVLSFVPLVGTAVVWVPVSIAVAMTEGLGWGLFVAAWNAGVTGTVDNIIKPLFLRGASNIHPLMIFLGVFGGLSWMGFAGVLVGPVLVAVFLALYTIYCEDYIGAPEASPLRRMQKQATGDHGAGSESPAVMGASEVGAAESPDSG